MELVILRMMRGADRGADPLSAASLTDIIWANARPESGLEHLYVRAGPRTGMFTVAMFIAPVRDVTRHPGARQAALRLCGSAIASSPALAAWAVSADDV